MAKKTTRKKASKKKAAKRASKDAGAPPPTAIGAGGGFTVPPVGGGAGGGVCPIQPDPVGHGDIDATNMQAPQLAGLLRQLASQGFVCLVWECTPKLWVRPVPPGGTIP